jgi:translation initiation factor 3 subunit G
VRSFGVSNAVLERRSWTAFGDALKGNEGCTTMSIDNITFEKPTASKADDDVNAVEKLIEGGGALVRCRKCGGSDHYTLKCPYREVMGGPGGDGKTDGKGGADGGVPGKYVPPALRGDAGASMAAGSEMSMDAQRRLRISDLSEDVEEEELRSLLLAYGKVEKLALRKKEMGGSAIAFVTFSTASEAQRAMQGLNGVGFQHLILRVEIAKSNKTEFSGSAGLSGMIASGYGKALPQSRPGPSK